MSAAQLTPTSDLDVVNGNITMHLIEVDKVTASDWVELTYPALWFDVKDLSGVPDPLAVYPTQLCDHADTMTAAETSITIASGTKTTWPATGTHFFVRLDNEIMEVSAWTDTTMTVRRGAMGTTAATHVAATPIYVLNSIVFVGSLVNKITIMVATRAVS